jgi:transcriptional regulator with XRE-family HTH domain
MVTDKARKKRVERQSITFEQILPPTPDQILARRESLNLTQTSMASFFGLSVSQYRNIERGRAPAPALMSRVFSWLSSGLVPPEFAKIEKP